MIIGSEYGTIIRTIYVIVPWTLTVPCSEWLYVVKFDSQSGHDYCLNTMLKVIEPWD